MGLHAKSAAIAAIFFVSCIGEIGGGPLPPVETPPPQKLQPSEFDAGSHVGPVDAGAPDAGPAVIDGGAAVPDAGVELPSWQPCSDQGQRCAFTGTRTVRFGFDGRYRSAIFTNGVLCDIASFGADPAPDWKKKCDTSDATPPPALGGPPPLTGLPPTTTRSVGCGLAATGADVFLKKTIDVLGVPRDYYLYLPPNYDSQRAYPLFFVFHGCGGNGSVEALDIRDFAQGNAILVAPNGLSPSTRCGGPGWSAEENDIPFFDAMLKGIGEQACINPKRVFSLGNSYGGEMTNRVSCRRGDKLRGTASFAGGFAGGADCTGLPATFLAHAAGDMSPAPFEASEQLIQIRLADRHCTSPAAFDLDSNGCRVYRGCDQPVVYCRLPAPPAGVDAHAVTFSLQWRRVGWDFLNALP
jgi:polyhydroxybutyrate depolymerase